MTVAEHLKAVHSRASGHHARLAKLHGELSQHHAGLSEHHAADPDLYRLHKDLGETHAKLAQEHEGARDFHRDCGEGLASLSTIKSAGGSAIAPQRHEGVSRITPFGQPTQPEIEDIPTEFSELVKTE